MATARGKKKAGALPKAERRQQILTAARGLFAKRGYHLTTIDDIVAQAGVARGTFYLYFEDKRAIFSDLIDRFGSQLAVAIVRIVIDDPAQSVGAQVHENIRRIIGTCLAERSMTKILLTDAVGVDPAFDRKAPDLLRSNVLLLMVETLKDGRAPRHRCGRRAARCSRTGRSARSRRASLSGRDRSASPRKAPTCSRIRSTRF